MVCDRCVMTVRATLKQLEMSPAEVGMGYAVVDDAVATPDRLTHLSAALDGLGFELIGNPEEELVERAKIALIEMARRDDGQPPKLSEEVSTCLGTDFKTLSRIFSAREGRTVERFFIAQKVEHVKELLDYGQLTLSEIAYRTGYSSVAHLSRQFKQVAGITATQYKLQGGRQAIDKV